LALGLCDFYEATFDRAALARAEELTEIMLREFWDDAGGAFFYTGKSHELLISRTKPVFDGSIPSGNAAASQLLLRFYHLTGKEDYLKRAEKVLRSYYDVMESQPFGFAHMLCALDLYLIKPKEIVVVGKREDATTAELLSEIQSHYLPNNTLQLVAPDTSLEQVSPLLVGKRQIDGKPTVYICENFTCSAPITTVGELHTALQR
jgi:uncharacterized protein YyaL (SSP411 family)